MSTEARTHNHYKHNNYHDKSKKQLSLSFVFACILSISVLFLTFASEDEHEGFSMIGTKTYTLHLSLCMVTGWGI